MDSLVQNGPNVRILQKGVTNATPSIFRSTSSVIGQNVRLVSYKKGVTWVFTNSITETQSTTRYPQVSVLDKIVVTLS